MFLDINKELHTADTRCRWVSPRTRSKSPSLHQKEEVFRIPYHFAFADLGLSDPGDCVALSHMSMGYSCTQKKKGT